MQVDPAAVEASGWGWRHATRKDFALRAVDFTIRPGERVLLLGASGAGKSTMMAGLAGVLGGDEEGEQEGSLTIDGVDAREARGRVGLVLQDSVSEGSNWAAPPVICPADNGSGSLWPAYWP